MSDIDDELFALAGGDEDADVEEGETSSVAASSPNSLGSDIMEESDSDDDDQSPTKDSDVPYPLDGKYVDSKDQQRINSLPQLERERILGERAEEQNRAQFAAELTRRAKGYEKSGPLSDRKRKASSIEPDDSQRKSSRQKVKGKTSDKLEAYKREREQRDQQRQRHDDRRIGHGRDRSNSDSRGRRSDVDADGESEPEYPDYEKAPRQEEAAKLHHFEAVRVGRGFFSTVCFNPGFEQALTGAFVRIGTGSIHGKTVYKMAQIKGFSTGKPYVFEGSTGPVATDQYVVAVHGIGKKEYSFSYCSNNPFTESDLDTYMRTLSDANSKPPTQTVLRKKYEDIKNLKEFFWTDADITAMIEKKKKFAHLIKPKVSQNSGPKPTTNTEPSAQRVAEINATIRRQESERVNKALALERRQVKEAQKKAKEEMLKKQAEAAAKQKAEEEKAAKKNGVDDLFDGDSAAGTPRAGTPKPAEKKKSQPRKGLPTFRKPKMDDDVIAAMDFGVDIDV